MVVTWSREAIEDLKQYSVHSKIITEGKIVKYINDLVDFVDSLKDNPKLGKFYIKYNNVSIRQLVYKIHSIFYYINSNEIIIIKFSNHSQNVDSVLYLIKEYINNIL